MQIDIVASVIQTEKKFFQKIKMAVRHNQIGVSVHHVPPEA